MLPGQEIDVDVDVKNHQNFIDQEIDEFLENHKEIGFETDKNLNKDPRLKLNSQILYVILS